MILQVVLAALLVAGGPATARAITYELNYEFSIPLGPLAAPEATVTLTDLGANIRFSVVNTLAGSQFSSLYFNFNGNRFGKDPDDLSFRNVKVNGATLSSSKYGFVFAPSETSTLGILKAVDGGYFDAKFSFTNDHYLAFNQTLTFDLSLGSSRNLAESDFQYASLPGGKAGTSVLAAYIRNIGPSCDSHWVGPNTAPAPVPLPAAVWLFGSGLAGMAGLARRRMTA